MDKSLLTVFCIFVFLSMLFCFIVSAIYFTVNLTFTSKAVKTPGEVVKLEEKKSTNGDNPLYRPVVEFVDENGNTHTFKTAHAHYPAMYKKGDSVAVLYHPQRPDRAMINDFLSLWLLPLILLILGIAQLIMLVLIKVFAKSAFCSKNISRRRNANCREGTDHTGVKRSTPVLRDHRSRLV